ncbi:isocyanide synthase family protein [Amycolatopsis sp. YIM 10]|uniref:isocyanide synthase family protein n=1 Tax=Amycolatopsis sp. YIM 10 TaxID=2653857 RepID=UPI0012901F02|nr:isocyanide synthase family protein [Amycolatopsis sp. YIM 10]QFU89907.1 Pyoverdine/dityrosine biosynthesis protein [Amycolatopsis sp. YIM 10]
MSTSTVTAGRLLRELFEVRRLHPGAGPCPDPTLDCCVRAHLPVVLPSVTAGRPVTCVLPAFPAKSPSPRKVLGPLPDLAEEQGLRFLHRLCLRLGELHPPGVRVVICSDGRVFSDVVGVSDEDVASYRGELEAMITRLGLDTLSVFCLDDALPGLSFDRMREILVRDHAEPLGAVRTRVLTDPEGKRLFNGIHRFLTEDRAAVEPLRSRSWLRRDCKDRAYRLIQRSAAWGQLVAGRFPDAVRLSIHPQAPHAPKIGVLLSDQPHEGWLTPWHSVCVRTGDGYRFMHRHQAESLDARLVRIDGRPSHYDLRPATPDVPAAAISVPGGNP